MKKAIGGLIAVWVMMGNWQTAWCAGEHVKREVRGVWMATVYAIDWPSKQGCSASVRDEQKAEMTRYLNTLQECNFNTVYFQVRSMCDAMYDSSYEPWSSYLTGKRGQDPGWDPLSYVVSECHKRSMECHAWVNPYRWATTEAGWSTQQDQFLKDEGMLLAYDNGAGTVTTILNPALPAVRERIVNVCRELMENYDIDGIIFDDYFYPSGIPTNSTAGDYVDYKNSKSKLSFADWRRENVNMMVADVYHMIQEVDPSCRFGISPAGVACTDATVASKHGITRCPVSSDWQYNGIFSDPIAWMEKGTVDYISPQIYWTTTNGTNPFGPITKWWSYVARHFKRHHYASHSLTFLQTNNNKTNWEDVGKQLQYSRNYTENSAPGAIYYSACDIDGKKVSGLGEWLLQNKYQMRALPPAIDWKGTEIYDKVTNLKKVNSSTLKWDAIDGVRYTVYVIPDSVDNEVFDQDKGGIPAIYLRGIYYKNQYTIPNAFKKKYHYAVCVFDRYGNEYAPCFSNEQETDVRSLKKDWKKEIRIYDLSGNLVASGTKDIVKSLPKGIYIIKGLKKDKKIRIK